MKAKKQVVDGLTKIAENPFLPRWVRDRARGGVEEIARLSNASPRRRLSPSDLELVEPSKCEAHDWPTSGLPSRLIDNKTGNRLRFALPYKERRHSTLKICVECMDRVVVEADRERQQVSA